MEEPPDGFGSQRSLPGAGSRAARGGDALCAGTLLTALKTCVLRGVHRPAGNDSLVFGALSHTQLCGMAESGGPFIEQIYLLQGYAEGWKGGTQGEKKIDERPCIDHLMYSRDKHGYYRGWFWGNKETQGLNTSGLSVQGSASIVAPILLKNSSAQGRVPGRGDPGQLRAGPGLRPPLAAGAHGEGAQEHPAVPAPQPQELHLDLRRLLRHDRVN
ncbi:uncharacterized protein LOC131574229 isoform X2 [Poecile atricapillus]|uniref:uncharacterized protein LOC131574229 isoform X2 n=1 Tax=Poecile atricapillus TaxID=48891 RepID=UPI0027389FC5|nr:uncharacterized protein LOC131574229 isoform X2 [Poecile atricapillus]